MRRGIIYPIKRNTWREESLLTQVSGEVGKDIEECHSKKMNSERKFYNR